MTRPPKVIKPQGFARLLEEGLVENMPRPTQRTPRSSASNRDSTRLSGGAASGGGLRFQAAVAACVSASIAAGEPLRWLDGIESDVPQRLRAESGGPGDDLAVVTCTGRLIEGEIKKGLSVGPRLWDALIKLARGLHNHQCDYAVLIVCPLASTSIRQGLRDDLVRLGEGRSEHLGNAARRFRRLLSQANIPEQSVAAHLRIVTMHCTDGDSATIAAAQTQLRGLCERPEQAQAAWYRLYEDAASQIALRGERTAASITAVLHSAQVRLRSNASSPAGIIAHLTHWGARTSAYFSIHGVRSPIELDAGWIQTFAVRIGWTDRASASVEATRSLYHERTDPSLAETFQIAAQTTGWFQYPCVVVAGPGMGKSTLTTVLSQRYSLMGSPVLRVALKKLAARIRHAGAGVEEGLLALGIDGSGLTPADVRPIGLNDWTLICDGLDETAEQQTTICQGLLNIAQAFPRCRIIITTRPVGYHTALLGSWLHYQLLPIESSRVLENCTMLQNAIRPQSCLTDHARAQLLTELSSNDRALHAARNPLILSLLVSLMARGERPGSSHTEIYERLFQHFERGVSERDPLPPDIAPQTARRLLDVLGWTMQDAPSLNREDTIVRCGGHLARELGTTALTATQIASRCIGYWESHGMVERIDTGHADALTFVHRTFQEYAAARYLARLPEHERSECILERAGEPEWLETLLFAAGMGAGADAVMAIVTHCHERRQLRDQLVTRCVQTLHLACAPAMLRAQVISMALEAVTSAAPHETTELCTELAQLALSSAPDFLPLVPRLLAHPLKRVQVIGWIAAVGLSGSDSQARQAAQSAALPLWGTLKTALGYGGMISRDFQATPSMREFMIAVAKLIVPRLPERDASAFAAAAAQSASYFPHPVRVEISQMLSQDRHADLFRYFGKSEDHLHSKAVHELDNASNICEQILRAFEAALTPPASPTVSAATFLHLSAFLSASKYGHFDEDEHRYFRSERVRLERASVQPFATEIFRDIVDGAGIDARQLVEDSLAFLAAAQHPNADAARLVRTLLLGVDIEIRTDLLQPSRVSIASLSEALACPSNYLGRTAATILTRVATEQQLCDALQSALTSCRWTAYQRLVRLAAQVPPQRALPVLLSRLAQPLVPECSELYLAAASMLQTVDHSCRLSSDITPAVRNGLRSDSPELALGALVLLAPVYHTDPELQSLLQEAIERWRHSDRVDPNSARTEPPEEPAFAWSSAVAMRLHRLTSAAHDLFLFKAAWSTEIVHLVIHLQLLLTSGATSRTEHTAVE